MITTTSTRSTHDAFDWMATLVSPAIASGLVYWIEPTSWAHDYWELQPYAGCWLRASIDRNSNEAYHLVLSCRGVWHKSLEPAQWWPIANVKVWTLDSAGWLAGLILMAAAEAGEDPSLVVPIHTPADKQQNTLEDWHS